MFAFGSWQGTAGSQRLELTLANVGTTGYTSATNCRFPQVGTHGAQPGNQRLPLQATARSCWEPRVAIAKNFQFLKVGTDGPQRGNQRLPWQGTAGSQTLKLTVCNLGTRGYHCKQLPVTGGWNSCFPTCEP